MLGGGLSLVVATFSANAPAVEAPQLQGFHLVAAHSGKVAAVAGGSVADGAVVVQAMPDSLNSQGWVALPFPTPAEFGPAAILVNLNSNKVLAVAGGSTANGATVIQEPWTGSPSQVWFLYAGGPFGPTHAIFLNANSAKVMDVAGASTADGASIIQWDYHGGANQAWQGFAVGVPASAADTP